MTPSSSAAAGRIVGPGTRVVTPEGCLRTWTATTTPAPDQSRAESARCRQPLSGRWPPRARRERAECVPQTPSPDRRKAYRAPPLHDRARAELRPEAPSTLRHANRRAGGRRLPRATGLSLPKPHRAFRSGISTATNGAPRPRRAPTGAPRPGRAQWSPLDADFIRAMHRDLNPPDRCGHRGPVVY